MKNISLALIIFSFFSLSCVDRGKINEERINAISDLEERISLLLWNFDFENASIEIDKSFEELNCESILLFTNGEVEHAIISERLLLEFDLEISRQKYIDAREHTVEQVNLTPEQRNELFETGNVEFTSEQWESIFKEERLKEVYESYALLLNELVNKNELTSIDTTVIYSEKEEQLGKIVVYYRKQSFIELLEF